MSYAGDVTPKAAYAALQEDEAALLVDVRTAPELTYVGLPDLSGIGKGVALVQWHPELTADQLQRGLADAGADADTPIYFLCRSGARSRNAAVLATQAGFSRAFNVDGGFEGPLDEAGHRGNESGWKADGLPWRQT